MVEQNVAQTPAKEYAEQGNRRDEVRRLFWLQHPQSTLRQISEQQESTHETKQISQTIPPQRQPAVNRQGDRIQIVHVNCKHAGKTHELCAASKP